MSSQGNYQSNRGGQQSNRGGQQFSGQQSNRGGQQFSGQQSSRGGSYQKRNETPVDLELTKPIPTIDAIDNIQRKWVGKNGRECDLIVNYFNMDIKPVKLFRYYVDIQYISRKKDQSEEEKTKLRLVKNRLSLRCVLWEFLRQNIHRDNKFKFVYDDKSMLISTIDIFNGEVDELRDEFDCKVPLRLFEKNDIDLSKLKEDDFNSHPDMQRFMYFS